MMAIVIAQENKVGSDSELLDYFIKRYQNPGKTPSLDMNFFTTYEPRFGFRLEFEVLMNSPVWDSLYQVMASLTPPSNPYRKPPSML